MTTQMNFLNEFCRTPFTNVLKVKSYSVLGYDTWKKFVGQLILAISLKFWFLVILTTIYMDHIIWSKAVNSEKLSIIDERGLIWRQMASRIRFRDKQKSDFWSFCTLPVDQSKDSLLHYSLSDTNLLDRLWIGLVILYKFSRISILEIQMVLHFR